MFKLQFKSTLSAIIITTFLWFFAQTALAADLTISCADAPNGCSKSGVSVLFSQSSDGLWYPGKTVTKTVEFHNTGSNTKDMGLQPISDISAQGLENLINV